VGEEGGERGVVIGNGLSKEQLLAFKEQTEF
jgi:hypothetical protein